MSTPELRRLASSPIGSLANTAALGAIVAGALMTTGCISDTDCGVCDPDKLVLESISGVNYTNRKVHRLTDGVDSGKYFIENISDCLETDEAKEAVRGAEEYCKLSPLVSGSGLEFVFNNLLDPTSVELVRKDPSNPQLFQIYDWKTQIAHIEGPVTRFNGDYRSGGDSADVVTRSVNLTCIDNLRAMQVDFDQTVLDENPSICEGFHEVDGKLLPLRMQASGITKSYGGETDWRASSCAAPDEGPDTCCTVADFELSVNVAKYGVDGSGTRLGPADGISCDPAGNVYSECANFETFVDRAFETNRYNYEWDGSADEFRLPLSDKVRETHPDARAAGVEPDGLPCQSDADCTALGSSPGASCIGTNGDGVACNPESEGCLDMHCKAEWFVTCRDDSANTGGAYCVDKRFKDKGAGACYRAKESFQSCDEEGNCTQWDAGRRLAYCDSGEFPDGVLSAAECCQDSLGGPANCDPLFQANVEPIERFDRDRTLPEETRTCYCGNPSNQPEFCAGQIERFCTAPWGSLVRHDGADNENAYVTRFVTKVGGVVYDPALKGILYLPGDRGAQPRSRVEDAAAIAVNPSLISGRNIQDGWRMHENAFFENYENYDRGMCSGSEYSVVFSNSGQQVRDKVGNVLGDDDLTYKFETPEFHVVPGTGYPTDNLRIGACRDFKISLSNRYDLSVANTKKIELVQIGRNTTGEDSLGESCATSRQPECWHEEHVVAGGPNCTEFLDEIDLDTPPCLTVDVGLHRVGTISVQIDDVRFGPQLNDYDPKKGGTQLDILLREISGRYRMRLPGLEGVERFEDLDLSTAAGVEAYEAAFHDVCGMPLITEGGQGYKDFYYDFTIDAPKCKEDLDGDGVEQSCDNAKDYWNQFQLDQDRDGFGDVSDLCVLTASDSNTADSDKDGVGNDCDSCRQTVNGYNTANKPDDARFWVRNIPFQGDFDQDGIGDVCDNCVAIANCGVFGPDTPHSVGTPVPYEDQGVCQQDADLDMIGDTCVNPDNPDLPIFDYAAGLVGFENDDDFDQDGLSNLLDYCPRQPVAAGPPTACVDDSECGEDGEDGNCAIPEGETDGVCNHLDTDGDAVGDICDTCPFKSNPLQVVDSGIQADDEDGDFVGAECETNAACEDANDPHPYAFMEVSVNGLCCATTYPGDGEYFQEGDGSWDCLGLCDPDGFPIVRDCMDEAVPGEDVPDGSKCRPVPNAVLSRPGVIELPPGCEEALETAGLCAPEGVLQNVEDPDCPAEMANSRLTLSEVSDPDELWGMMCFLPQWDQDFDGVGDTCDLCEFNFDPFNESYVDENTGKLWDNLGRYCSGSYAANAVCAAEDEADTGGETGDGDTGDTGGESDG